MSVIIKRPPTAGEQEEARIWALWLLYGKMPPNAKPDVDGKFELGEIGETRSDRGVERDTPYSPGRIR
jgi:hypothetical protein